MVLDPSKMTAGPSASPLGAQAPVTPEAGLPALPTLKAPDQHAGEAPWDTLGRLVWGTKEEGGTLGQVPILGDIMRIPGQLTRGAVQAGGFGVGAVINTTADVLGRVPNPGAGLDYGLGQVGATGINAMDPKYNPETNGYKGPVVLIDDMNKNGNHNLADQFLVLGQWQQKYDPQEFKNWQETLAKAQASTGIGSHAADLIQNYIRQASVGYYDLTPEGVTGLLDTNPELAFAGPGASLGNLTSDALGMLMLAQRKAERQAAVFTGSQGGGFGPIPLGQHQVYAGHEDMGSRLNELLYLADTAPNKLTPIEAAAVDGLKSGWTGTHAMNFLLDHGAGYSSNPATQLVTGFALDPIGIATMGAGSAAKVGQEVAAAGGSAARYGNLAENASRLSKMSNAITRSVGTTVDAVRTSELGPAFKVARTVLDPFSFFGKGPAAAAKVDLTAAAGLEGTKRGFGAAAVTSALRRASNLGSDVKAAVDQAFGTTAMNFVRKWGGQEVVTSLVKQGETGARRVIAEEALGSVLSNAPKDAVGRIADFVMKNREFWLSSTGLDQLSERVMRLTGQTLDDAKAMVGSMSRDEQAVWHAMTYNKAFTDFVTAVSRVPADGWGNLASKLDNLVILNPQELDNMAAQGLLRSLTQLGEKSTKKAVEAWNEAAAKYDIIENMGRITAPGKNTLSSKMAMLQDLISSGRLHGALSASEMKNLPKQFVDEFMGRWTGADGQPIWRLGFKPNAEQATGLVWDASGEKLVARYAPSIENVTTAIPMARGASGPVTDILGRVISSTRVGQAGLKARDMLDVVLENARDNISGQRMMTSIEQSFRRQARDWVGPNGERISDKAARALFRVNREYSSVHGFTLAGMSPDDFWRASESTLRGVVDVKIAKRDIFSMLANATGGDLRLLGLSSGMTQRIRSGLIARGLDPNNYLGAVTVKTYNAMRYVLNPTFFFQAQFDAPWFNMFRGIMPDLLGKNPAVGSKLWDMQRISKAMSTTGMFRDLSADFTERSMTAGWQRAVHDSLDAMPGMKQGILSGVTRRLGRSVLNNELLYMNSQVGNVVFDALDQARKFIDDKIANASNDFEREAWQNTRIDTQMWDHLRTDFADKFGHLPSNEELGRWYLSDIIHDSQLAIRTPEGLADYSRVMSKGEYMKPSTVGDLKPLQLDYGAEAIGLPNVHNAADLREALGAGRTTIGQITETMLHNGFHRDAIKRFTTAIQFNWRSYFDGMRKTLGMTQYEMQGIEDMIQKQARRLGMSGTDFFTQVLPMTTKGAGNLDEHLKFVLDTMRLSQKGQAGMEELTKLVTSHLQPSMKVRLLDHFMESLTGPNGLIQKAMDAGDVARSQSLNQVLEDLRGGWGKAADQEFKDLVLRRAAGEAILEPEVERAARFFSQFLQDIGPQVQAGEVAKAIVENIPVEGASAYDMTQTVLMNALYQNFRLAEKDALRLAYMSTERTGLGRSLNHPFFAMYPTSYFWGKVIPETFKFIASEPFGVHTTLGAETYAKAYQTIALQSQNDPRMKDLWDKVGKSATMGLLSYLSPGMPWEDMRSNLPPWLRSMAKDPNIWNALTSEFDTMSPERWVQRFEGSASEIAGAAKEVVGGILSPQQQQSLQTISTPTGAPATPAPSQSGFSGPVKGTGLAPVLSGDLSDLEKVLSGR